MEQKPIVHSIEIILTAIALTIALGIMVAVPESSASSSAGVPRSFAAQLQSIGHG